MTLEETTGIVVFSRYDSARLPGKALIDINARPLLGRVLDRVRQTEGGSRVIVATSDRPIDNVIAVFAEREKVDCFRGSVDDVLGRSLACAETFNLSHIVRISGDSPFIDPTLIAKCLGRLAETKADIVTNVFPRSYPPGISVEVLTRSALVRVTEATSDPSDREHVTKYIYDHADEFHIENISAGNDRYIGIRLTVDTDEDLENARVIANGLKPDADLDEIVERARKRA